VIVYYDIIRRDSKSTGIIPAINFFTQLNKYRIIQTKNELAVFINNCFSLNNPMDSKVGEYSF